MKFLQTLSNLCYFPLKQIEPWRNFVCPETFSNLAISIQNSVRTFSNLRYLAPSFKPNFKIRHSSILLFSYRNVPVFHLISSPPFLKHIKAMFLYIYVLDSFNSNYLPVEFLKILSNLCYFPVKEIDAWRNFVCPLLLELASWIITETFSNLEISIRNPVRIFWNLRYLAPSLKPNFKIRHSSVLLFSYRNVIVFHLKSSPPFLKRIKAMSLSIEISKSFR